MLSPSTGAQTVRPLSWYFRGKVIHEDFAALWDEAMDVVNLQE